MEILAIETSCDETAASIVRDGREILSNVVVTQIDLHKRYGGVVPELACRRHIDLLPQVVERALNEADRSLGSVDKIAVTRGPGLIGALLVGVHFARALALATKKPLIPVDHILAHCYGAMMGREKEISFPLLCIVLSGGHTLMLIAKSDLSFNLISKTCDDALGEAFDKVGRMLGLLYPAGSAMERLAVEGNSHRFDWKAGYVKRSPLDFSFSGLKTAVQLVLQKEGGGEQTRADVAASFQKTVFSDVLSKARKAFEQFDCKAILFGGGVSCNQTLALMAKGEFGDTPLFFPPKELALDNGAMIAGFAFHCPIPSMEEQVSFQPYSNFTT